MVESIKASGFEKIVTENKLMTVIVLLPFLKIRELIRFCRLNKACYKIMTKIVNFQVLFKTQGLNLTPTQWEAFKVSASIALQAAVKYMMLKSISKSQRIIGINAVNNVKTTVCIPNMLELGNKSAEELKNLVITKVNWKWFIRTLSLTLNDSQTCLIGTLDCDKSHFFDLSKKITKIESIINKFETMICQINFYHNGERLVEVGRTGESFVSKHGGRVEVFDIAEDEQLIGCELDEEGDNFRGLTWIKMKVIV